MNEFIDIEKFDKIYNAIEPNLKSLEIERKKMYRKYSVFCHVCLVIFFIFFTIYGLVWVFKDIIPDSLLICLGVYTPFIAFLGGLFLYGYSDSKRKEVIDILKDNFLKKIFDFFGLEYTKYKSYNCEQIYPTVIKKYLKKYLIIDSNIESNLNDKYKDLDFEDSIIGRYKDLEFEIVDTKIYPKENYILLSTKINKSFTKSILISDKKEKTFVSKLPWVKLEDIEFNKQFKTYSNDQIEARYLLTTAFIERLLKYKRTYKSKITVIFENINCDKNIFVLINTKKDNFEIPMNQSILNKKLYYDIFKELTDVLEIINALKLEQNTGL